MLRLESKNPEEFLPYLCFVLDLKSMTKGQLENEIAKTMLPKSILIL